ncbi:hypothetical protein [Deinococcus koreensis]|uniref:Periplasmic heavy metal sensor n=1 Tax=Deinococcus koreensis TaxID=2054903 RepID=A0A2K3UT56_9DEIO|nr:hypothetical protein [Deinococcus koreensis]PNY79698.1 hypothetical protein CVO96_17205 [Deinococcus koreensis]
MRWIRLKSVPVSLALGLGTLASAQTGPQGGQAPTLTPEMRARMAQMQPVIDLAQTVRLLPELEKNAATAVNRAQAKALLTILTTLQRSSAVQPNDARKYLTQIEDRILTEKQLSALDGLVIKAEAERAAQRARRPAGGAAGQARIPGLPGGGFGGQRPGGPAGQGGAGGQNAQPGSFNPFREGRGADALGAYIAALRKK